ncbi:hypothetical protein BJ546DRAFT_366509 [Cryomyces antarcticus]|uniref:Cell wall protein Ecm33 n=1 Tax=Cryomyces antarcticus TaxID=329879 RepID=A0ABR0LR47_9PEZI|nr:cell wall protein Ecm33 [Cryomyces antarcticus]KAK5020112.1 cell wall protein Ecm33 [Cryomyces antarcticus]KAK5202121.1 cell wall protein Ecm33 [Cryomyces antarcticus]
MSNPPASAICNAATTTVRHSADALALAGCKTYTGTIAIATDSAATVDLDGVQELHGSLIVANNTGLNTLSASSLQSISDTLMFSNLSIFNNMTFPSLRSINTLILSRVPSPNIVNLYPTGAPSVINLQVTNTYLEGLSSFSLQTSQLQTLVIVNNSYLETAQLAIGNITQQARIANNGGNLTVSFPNLVNAYDLDIANCTYLELPELVSVSNNLKLSWNSFLSLELPNLTFTGGGLNITNNNVLADIAFGHLVSVNGDLNILENPKLANLSGFPGLSSVGAKLDLTGAFTNVSLPALRNVRGDMTVQSSESLNCTALQDEKFAVHGKYVCLENSTPTSSAVNATTTQGASGSTSSARDMGIGVGLGLGLGIFLLAAVVASIMFFRRRRDRRRKPAGYGDSEKPIVTNPTAELPGKLAVAELAPWHGTSEMGRSTSKSAPGREQRHELHGDEPRSELLGPIPGNLESSVSSDLNGRTGSLPTR